MRLPSGASRQQEKRAATRRVAARSATIRVPPRRGSYSTVSRSTLTLMLAVTSRCSLTGTANSLKNLGEFAVPVKLHRDVTASIKVKVERETVE